MEMDGGGQTEVETRMSEKGRDTGMEGIPVENLILERFWKWEKRKWMKRRGKRIYVFN